MRMHNPAHPGEVLREWLDGISITEAAKKLGITRVTLSRILNAKSSITPEMALRLSQALNTSAEMWLDMQSNYDLWQAEQRIDFKIEPFFAPLNS